MKLFQEKIRIRRPKRRRIHVRMTPTRAVVLCFLAVIAVGTLLLMLPFSTRAGETTTILDAAFTSVSATCVTGLVVHDTYLHWTLFGQIVILLLVQIGGLGLMTLISMLSVILGRGLSLYQRRMMMETSLATEQDSARTMVGRVVCGTFVVEGVGTLLLTVPFSIRYGFFRGLWMGVFHSVTAFCNAGFDILGREGAYASLTPFANDAFVLCVIAVLIIVGGIGFPVWNDLMRCRFRFRNLSLHSKIVISTSFVLIIGGTGLFYLFEHCSPNGALASQSDGQALLSGFFQSVSARTAGMNSFEQSEMTSGGTLLTVVLMLIGGSPGSTAGGIKTTTIAVMILAAQAWARKNNEITVFHRSIEDHLAGQASAIALFYLGLLLTSTFAVGYIDALPLESALFVSASAVGTVGFSNFLTSSLSMPSQIILMVLMFAGRVGALSLALAFGERRKIVPLRHPDEKIMIG